MYDAQPHRDTRSERGRGGRRRKETARRYELRTAKHSAGLVKQPEKLLLGAENAHLPFIVTHRRRVARLGLAMGNLESDWDFAPSSLALATTSGHVALRICAVDLMNALQTAEALDKSKQCLAAAQISVEVADIKIKPLRAGSKSTRQDIFVVATLLPKASKMLRLLCDGPPGAYRHLFDLKETGGIPSKGACDPRFKVAKLPFNGAKFATMALVRSALCVTALARSDHSTTTEEPAPSVTLPPTSVHVIVWCGDTSVLLRSLDDRCERNKRASRAWSARWPASPKGRIESEQRGPSQLRGVRGVSTHYTVPITNRHDSSWFESFRSHFALFWSFWSFWLAISEPGWTSRKQAPLGIRLKSTRPSKNPQLST